VGTARRCVGTSSGGRALRRGAPRPRGGRGPRDADRPSRHSPAPASPQTPLTHTSMAATGDSVVAAVEAAVMAAEGTPASPPRNGGLLSTHTQSSRSQVQPSKVMARSTGARRCVNTRFGEDQRHWSTDDHTIDATYLRRILNPGQGQGQRNCPYSTRPKGTLSRGRPIHCARPIRGRPLAVASHLRSCRE